MRTLVWLTFFCLLAAGCADIPRGFYAVWALPLPPPENMQAPAGFTTTPPQAFQIARESGSISRKHILHLYADATHYYVHDVMAGIGAHRAIKQSVRINGRTGKVEKTR